MNKRIVVAPHILLPRKGTDMSAYAVIACDQFTSQVEYWNDLKDIIGDIYKPDVVMIPIGDKFTMGPFEAALASMWLNPKVTIPMHYNTFPPIVQDPTVFANFVMQFNPKISTVILNPNEYFEYNPDEYQD